MKGERLAPASSCANTHLGPSAILVENLSEVGRVPFIFLGERYSGWQTPFKPQFQIFIMSANQSSTILLPNQEEPIRSELFSLERLEQHAESLAAAQAVTTRISRGARLSLVSWKTAACF